MYDKIIIYALFSVWRSTAQQCAEDGVFGVDFTSCKTYRVCNSNVGSTYTCSTISSFDQRAQECRSNFICPDTNVCRGTGYYPDPNYPDPRYYINCTQSGTTVPNRYVVKYLDCGPNQIFDFVNTPSTRVNCRIDSKVPSPDCEEEGVFHVYHTDCKTYMVCTKKPNGFFDQAKFPCSSVSLFDPWKKQCVKGYDCLEKYCTTEGSFHFDKNDPTGNHYYKCVKDTTGQLVPLYLKMI